MLCVCHACVAQQTLWQACLVCVLEDKCTLNFPHVKHSGIASIAMRPRSPACYLAWTAYDYVPLGPNTSKLVLDW